MMDSSSMTLGGWTNSTLPAYYSGLQGTMAITPTLKERLAFAVEQAEERLKAAKEAQEIFSRNPDIERLLDIMQRGTF